MEIVNNEIVHDLDEWKDTVKRVTSGYNKARRNGFILGTFVGYALALLTYFMV